MKITIFNGNADPDNSAFEDYLAELAESLWRRGQDTEVLILRDVEIKRCTGCFGCWVKTPGRCVVKDGSGILCERLVGSDFLLFASPIVMGFTSGLLRRASEKLLPTILPYFRIVDGEMRHWLRYDKYPVFGLLVEREDDTDSEDLEILEDIYSQIAKEMQSELRFLKSLNDRVEEVADAIGGI